MRVLDLFSGLGGATSAFQERGHETVSVDREERFQPTIVADVMDLSVEDLAAHGPFDFVWASPPCQRFSVMTIGQCWDPDGRPRLGATRMALALVEHTLYLIEGLRPRAWILENPVGMLRVQPFMKPFERRTVTYCRYGMPYRKATDLWGGFPQTLRLRQPCKPGASCHQPSPRGSKAGLQGRDIGTSAPYIKHYERAGIGAISLEWMREAWEDLNTGTENARSRSDRSALRALVPYELSLAVCEAMESWDGGRWEDATLRPYLAEAEK